MEQNSRELNRDETEWTGKVKKREEMEQSSYERTSPELKWNGMDEN